MDSSIGSGSVSYGNAAGNGAHSAVKFLTGTTTTKLNFGPVFGTSSTFTICTVSRYNGGANQRIFQASSNWLWGHHNGRVGVAHTSGVGWVTPYQNNYAHTSHWIVMCGQNGPNRRIRVNSNGGSLGNGNTARCPGTQSTEATRSLYINCPSCAGSGEVSDFAVAEVPHACVFMFL